MNDNKLSISAFELLEDLVIKMKERCESDLAEINLMLVNIQNCSTTPRDKPLPRDQTLAGEIITP